MVSRPKKGSCPISVARLAALELLKRVDEFGAYANIEIGNIIRNYSLDSRDAGFAQELVFGVLRNRSLYSAIISSSARRSTDQIDPQTHRILEIGAYQLLNMRVPPHAAINETVKLSKAQERKISGFVNAVLRRISEKNLSEWENLCVSAVEGEPQKLAMRYSHPLWIIDALGAARRSWRINAPLEDLLSAHNRPAKVSIAALPTEVSESELESLGITGPVSPYGYEIEGNPGNLSLVTSGKARVQDQGSQLAALVAVSAEVDCEDSLWLDMCAGPGGKAALLASFAKKNGASLECIEIHEHRAKLLADTLKRFPEVKITVADATELGETARYSRILLDAPCSGLGALRRRPEARWRKKIDDIESLIDLQRKLIAAAWRQILPGGILCYVTCSPLLAETVAQVDWAERNLRPSPSPMSVPNVIKDISPGLEVDSSKKAAQLWPDLHNSDGMFIAVLQKVG